MTSTALREGFARSRYYFPARTTVDRALRPRRAARRRQRLEFLREVVTPGQLVFDVGANVGEYAELYQALGCRVVAVEPFPASAQILRSRLPGLIVVEAAVGAQVGEATMHIGEDALTNTLSEHWAAVLHEHGQTEKPDTVTVPVTTLDAIATEYGTPDYVKIDVEGYEQQALAGMTFRPALLSFEIHSALIEEADACLRAVSGRQFSLTVAENFAWAGRGLDRQQLLELIAKLGERDPDLYGDVYASPV
jgi:FkbM family methyltransferase